jgi:hypothetical protein
MDKALLINLHQYPEFQILLTELKGMRPILPTYDVNLDKAEQWRFKSAQQLEYDAIMAVINPFREPT